MRRTPHAGQPFLFVRFRFCGGPFTWADVFLHGHLLMVSTLSTKQPCREGPCWLVINLGFCQGAKGMQELTAPNVCAPHNSSDVRVHTVVRSAPAFGIYVFGMEFFTVTNTPPTPHATYLACALFRPPPRNPQTIATSSWTLLLTITMSSSHALYTPYRPRPRPPHPARPYITST